MVIHDCVLFGISVISEVGSVHDVLAAALVLIVPVLEQKEYRRVCVKLDDAAVIVMVAADPNAHVSDAETADALAIAVHSCVPDTVR